VQTPDGAFHLLMKSDLEHIDYEQQSLMPANYAQRLNSRELDDLVSFLTRSASAKAKSDARTASQEGLLNVAGPRINRGGCP
jgi:hypothetical protein